MRNHAATGVHCYVSLARDQFVFEFCSRKNSPVSSGSASKVFPASVLF